jgi:ribosomal peptide maturation radical SAM protein 1
VGQKKKCTFCGRNNENITFRPKSPQKVLRDLRSIKEHYPNIAVAMTDDIMPSSYPQELLPILAKSREYPSISMYYVKANLRLNDLILLKQAQVKSIIPGIEALSTGLLKLLNKGVTARQNLQFLRNARSVGMNLVWFMLWGIPGDKVASYEEILNLLPLIRHLQPPIKFLCVHLERNSAYVANPAEYNITNLRPWAVYKMIYPEWADINKLASFFVGEYPCAAYEHPELIQQLADELVYWRKAWKTSKLAIIPFADYYIVYDSRNIPGTSKQHILEASQAQEIMTYCVYKESETQKWAVEHKLGVILDSWYVPLVTAKPELLLEFEGDSSGLKYEE